MMFPLDSGRWNMIKLPGRQGMLNTNWWRQKNVPQSQAIDFVVVGILSYYWHLIETIQNVAAPAKKYFYVNSFSREYVIYTYIHTSCALNKNGALLLQFSAVWLCSKLFFYVIPHATSHFSSTQCVLFQVCEFKEEPWYKGRVMNVPGSAGTKRVKVLKCQDYFQPQ